MTGGPVPPGGGMQRNLPGRRGARLGVDVGTVRVGVAVSDPDGILVSPVTTLSRDIQALTDVAALATLVTERDVVEVVVGLPRTLRGDQGPAAAAARAYGDLVAARIAPVPVVFTDERLTTVLAHRGLAERGMNSRARRAVVDQAAAVAILQSRLDELRRAGADERR